MNPKEQELRDKWVRNGASAGWTRDERAAHGTQGGQP